jgi:hypothetical protein
MLMNPPFRALFIASDIQYSIEENIFNRCTWF